MKGLVLALAFFAGPIAAQEPPEWFAASLLDLPEDVAEAAAQGKRVMLYFGQDGCPYCKRLMEVNFRNPAIVAKMQRHFMALAINIWGDRDVTWTDGVATSEKRLAAALKVQFTPTLLFLDERGAIALRLNGYYPPREFEAALDRAAAKQSFAQKIEPSTPAPAGAKTFHDLRRRPGGKPLAVIFEAPQCAQCEELHAVVLKRHDVREQMAKFDVARLGVAPRETVVTPDGKKIPATDWSRAMNVGYLPTMVLFDARGREIFRTEAYLRPFHVAGALDYVSSGAYRKEPSFQRFLQAKAERMRARGEAVDLWD